MVNGLLGSGGTSAYNEEFVQHTLKMLRVSCVSVVRSVILRFSSRFVPQSLLKELCDLSRGYSFIAEAYGAILDESGALFIDERAGDETRIVSLALPGAALSACAVSANWRACAGAVIAN